MGTRTFTHGGWFVINHFPQGGCAATKIDMGLLHSQRRESTKGTRADQGARVTISEIGIIKHCARKGARALKGAVHPEAFNTRT